MSTPSKADADSSSSKGKRPRVEQGDDALTVPHLPDHIGQRHLHAAQQIKEATAQLIREAVRHQKRDATARPLSTKKEKEYAQKDFALDRQEFDISFRHHMRGALLSLQRFLSARKEKDDLWIEWAVLGGDVREPGDTRSIFDGPMGKKDGDV